LSAASRAKSKLFLSCDLVGSTHFKQTTPGWQKVFLSFYREFPQFVAEANRAIPDEGTTDFLLWKAVGDELIFEVHVTNEKSISRAVRVWLSAMTAYEEQVLEDAHLALKGGAFIATFPGPDSESTIPRNVSYENSDASVVLLNQAALTGARAYTKYLYDYFGPSIDTGFRVFSLCSHRYFTLSIEVAWAIAAAAHEASGAKLGEEDHTVEDFVFHGSHILKGVWLGREYPVFAIDRAHTNPVNKAMATMNDTALDAAHIIGVCHACHEDAKWPFRLYLPDSTNATFLDMPEDAMDQLLESEAALDGAETAPAPDGGDPLEQQPPLG